MKSNLLLLAGFAGALSLASCSDNKSTTETTTSTTPADSTGTATSTTTTRTYSDADYHTRGDRMAMKFASANKISDQATLAKLKTAYYNRAKRYDEMMTKFKADTAGMAQAKRDYMKANDQEFQTILVVPTQYQAYQSSNNTPDYNEDSNLDIANQSAASSATMPSDSSSSMSNGSSMNSSSTSTDSSSSTSSTMPAGTSGTVAKSKTKLQSGAKIKVKGDEVKLKAADGTKTKM